MSEVIKPCEEGNAAAQPVPVRLPRNIASEPAPPKADLIQQHQDLIDKSTVVLTAKLTDVTVHFLRQVRLPLKTTVFWPVEQH